MFDHVGLTVRDLPKSLAFYKDALAPLGYALCSEGDGYAGFGPGGIGSLWLYATDKVSSSTAHVGLKAANALAVQGFYGAGLKAGGLDHGAPGLRPDYGSNYYAAFLNDPDGNNIEAVCLVAS